MAISSVVQAENRDFVKTVLKHYASVLPAGTFPLPLGGFDAFLHLSRLTRAPTLALVGDKAFAHLIELVGVRDPHIALHGSAFSLMANLHALRLFALAQGGFSLATPFLDGAFKCAAFWLPGARRRAGGSEASAEAARPALDLVAADAQLLPPWALAEVPEMAAAWVDTMDGFGPDTFNTLQRCLRDEIPAPSLKLALSTLRLSCWDPDVFTKFRDVLIDRTPQASERAQADIYRDVSRVYERFFPVSPTHDVAFDVARVCMGLRRYAEAITLFLASMRHTGEHNITVYNVGICLFHCSRFDLARAAFYRSLELNREYKDAANWLARVDARIAVQAREDAAAAASATQAAPHTHSTHSHGGEACHGHT